VGREAAWSAPNANHALSVRSNYTAVIVDPLVVVVAAAAELWMRR